MKNYEEMSKSVLERIDEYNTQKERKKRTVKKFAVPIAVTAVVVVATIGIIKSGVVGDHINKSGGEETTDILVNEDSNGDTVIVSNNNNETSNDRYGTTEAYTSQPNSGEGSYGGEQSGGSVGGWDIPVLPFDRHIEVIGEELTDEEAAEYFKENTVGFKNELTASGVPADNLVIMPKGYCHVSYSGVEGKPFELKQNFRDYLAYNGDKLVAIITLTKEDGKLYATPAFGGPWFDDYNAVLQQHKGEELVYVYAGWMEFVVTPDGKYFNPLGYELGLEFGTDDIYRTFYHEKAVYVP